MEKLQDKKALERFIGHINIAKQIHLSLITIKCSSQNSCLETAQNGTRMTDKRKVSKIKINHQTFTLKYLVISEELGTKECIIKTA